MFERRWLRDWTRHRVNVSVLRACFDLVRRYLPTSPFSWNYQYRSLDPSLQLSSFQYNDLIQRSAQRLREGEILIG
ncbi:hypothetical protein PILCRDRAFT_827092 [Piloderma croceum F 1598]|uniref:Uncharacterized protein n=1 Tax=Piloderma croceum (strain F 1598) TaxID=765440 RepID=A0A0C3BEC4_PILCF|nr:hypothetical protein PILCRDRAFT_827092 [Piloderma croceum F 1598]